MHESTRHTLGELIDRFLTSWLPQHPSWLSKKIPSILWWKKRLGNVTLSDLTSIMISEARDELLMEITKRKTIRKPSSVNRYLAALSKVLTIGVKEWGWIENSPMRKVIKPKEGNGQDRLLTLEEKDRLLEACRISSDPYLYPIVSLSLLTGMRLGEITGLKWDNIDFENKWIIIQNTKNGETRMLPLTCAVEKILNNIEPHSFLKSPQIFIPRTIYNKIERVNIYGSLKRALHHSKIEGFTFHLLRHAAASYFAMAGATQGELMNILGHKSPAMTHRYVHYSQKHMSKVMERMQNKLYPVPPHSKL